VNTLPIADCRLPITESFAGRGLARRGHDGGQFIGFIEQRGQFFCGHDARFSKQLEPESGFVGFFLDGADFGNEFRLAARAATGTVISCYRSAAADNLSGNSPASIVGFRNGTGELDDSQRKSFRASLEFGWVHGANLQTQSAIGNRQSAIQR